MPNRPLQKYAAVELALKAAAAAVFNAPRTAAKLNPAFVKATPWIYYPLDDSLKEIKSMNRQNNQLIN